MTTRDRPLVSIIVPVYNVERYIDCCLDSIRGQTYDSLEILVVEDCSTDDSLAQLQPHLSDSRVRLIRHERNSGLSAARNSGIEAATGDYVLFVDSDDAIGPHLVETCVRHAEATRADLVVFDFVAFQDGERLPELGGPFRDPTTQQPRKVEYFRLPHFAWLKFIRRGLLAHSRLRFPVGRYYEDWPFHWELGFLAPRIERIRFGGVAYRLRPGSITASSGAKLLHIYEAQRLVADVAAFHRCDPEITREVARKACSASWFVLMNVESGFIGSALQAWRRYAKQHPMPFLLGTPKAQIALGLAFIPARVALSVLNGMRWMSRYRSSKRALATASGEVKA